MRGVIFTASCIIVSLTVSAQKKNKIKDTVQTLQILNVISDPVEVDFDPTLFFLACADIKSPHKTASEWLKYVSATASATSNSIYDLQFFKSQKPQQTEFVFYLHEKPQTRGLAVNAEQDTSGSLFFVVPLTRFADTSWEEVRKAIATEIREFTNTEPFIQSPLSKAKAIIAENDQGVIWANPSLSITPELRQLKEIALALFDYNGQRKKGQLVIDGKDYYLQWSEIDKNKIDVYYLLEQKGKLLQLIRHQATSFLYDGAGDLNTYIKQKTGSDYDIFADVKEKAATVLNRNKIVSEEEAQNALIARSVYSKSAQDRQKADELSKLIQNYYQQNSNRRSQAEGVTSAEPRFYFKEIAEFKSPNKKFTVRMSETGENKSTAETTFNMTVNLENNGSIGTTIYTQSGADLGITAYWKDSNTFVIETKKEHKTSTKVHEVRSYDNVVKIEYVEK